jgi:hypothetical protein
MGIDPPQPAPPLMLLSTVLHRNSPDPTLCYSTRNPFELYSAALYHNILLLQHYDTANIVLLGIAAHKTVDSGGYQGCNSFVI